MPEAPSAQRSSNSTTSGTIPPHHQPADGLLSRMPTQFLGQPAHQPPAQHRGQNNHLGHTKQKDECEKGWSITTAGVGLQVLQRQDRQDDQQHRDHGQRSAELTPTRKQCRQRTPQQQQHNDNRGHGFRHHLGRHGLAYRRDPQASA